VRRAATATLIIVLALPGLLPLWTADSESSLPACCRRDGGHHCAMLGGMAPSSAAQDATFRAASGQCPYQKALAAVHVRGALFPGPSAGLCAADLSHPGIQIPTCASNLIPNGRSHQKRGPPLTMSC
jgi:hypothetical protein